jgi:hypothetical protein
MRPSLGLATGFTEYNTSTANAMMTFTNCLAQTGGATPAAQPPVSEADGSFKGRKAAEPGGEVSHGPALW